MSWERSDHRLKRVALKRLEMSRAVSHDGLGRAARRAGLGEEGMNSWVRGALAGVLDQESGQERLEATGLQAGAGGSCSTAARFPTASSCGNGSRPSTAA